MKPLVSIIIPCRNEEKFISKCLESLVSQDYPKESLEILVVDGQSRDKTKEVVEECARKCPFVKLLENPEKFTPFGFNIGINRAKGEIIMLAGAHAAYDKTYLSKCVKYLEEYRADNVGGVLKTVPKEDTFVARAIAIAFSHPFGAGSSYYRTGLKEPRRVDTVFGGCYKKEVFDKVGLFNENLIRSQDMEFNMRLKKAGGKILLHPGIVAYYYPQADLVSFSRHNFLDGTWTTYPLKFGIRIFSWRHIVPLVFVAGLIGSFLLGLIFSVFKALFFFGLFLYLAVGIYFSLRIVVRERDPRYIYLMPLVFACRHFGYGLGSVWGLLKLLK